MERSLDIEITRRCNLRCDYCFVGWSRDWTSDLPRAVAEEVIREGAGRFDLLHITGGEPFARRDLFDLLDLAFALGYPAALINTNGTMLRDGDIARLGAYGGRVALSVSFDGPAHLHDAIRGEGRFAQADRTTEKLLDAGVPVTLMTVVTPAVLAVLPTFLFERARRHPRMAGVTLFPVGVGPSGTQKPGAAIHALSPDDVRALAAHTALAWRVGIRVRVGAFPMINPLLRALGYPADQLYQCAAGRGRVCVHADQGVSSCHPVKDPIYGRWSSGLFDRIESDATHRALRDRDFDGCRDCDHREDCGHCRAFVTSSNVPLLGNDLVCHDVVPGRREAYAVAARPAPPPDVPAHALTRRNAAVTLVRRFAAVLGNGRWEDLASVVAPDCDDRNPVPLQPRGRDGVCFKLALHRAQSPASRSRFLDVRAIEGGAEARWETVPAPGAPADVYHGRFTVRDGLIRAFEVDRVA